MSWKAVQAVRDNSKQKDPTSRLILMVIASYCNHKLNMNNAKNTPSAAKIAEGAGCHINTAKKHIAKLLETDELSVKKEGSGRGTKMRYTIHLGVPLSTDNYPSNVPLSDSNGTPQSVPISDNGTPTSTDNIDHLTRMVHELKLMVHENKLMVHEMVHNGTRPSRVEGDSKGSKGLSKGESKGKDTRTPSHYQSFEAIHSERPEQVQIMFEVLMGIVRNSRKVNEVDEAAYSLIDSGYTPSQINKWFGEGAPFWYQEKATFSKGYPPYTGNILDESICAKIWESAGSVVSGGGASGGAAGKAWVIVKRQASAGKFAFDDKLAEKAVRIIGWGNLRNMEQRQIPMYKKAFIDNYKELSNGNGQPAPA